MCNEYNGYSNYETWAVCLWADNCQATQSHMYFLAIKNDFDVYETSKAIKDWHEEIMPEVSGVFSDLLNAAMSTVDWYEIGRVFADNAKEELEYASE